ncbi:MAG: ABC transporter ATP-binding protein [Chthoniobacterales bacterium]
METPVTSVVELRDLHLRFGAKQVLDGVSLAVAPQERVVIIGQSGAGKTTILRSVLGVLIPDSGGVFFEGRNIAELTHEELQQARQHIGMVYQDGALLSSLNVHDNLALPLQELTDKTRGEIDKIVEEKLDLVEMQGEGRTMPAELSGGMRKRVGFARALVMHPKLILFDEPTAGLDPVISSVIDDLIVRLTEQTKATSIIVTHLMDSAFRVATRIAMLYGGKIIADATPAEIRRSEDAVVHQFITGTLDGPILQRPPLVQAELA